MYKRKNKEVRMVRLSSKSATPTAFKIYAPQAKKVSVAGSFNNWDTQKLSAKKDSRGNWQVKASLKPGRYEYKFIVDGSWIADPNCAQRTTNSFGSQNSVIEVK
ncbi:MAG: glycogen-binding domain-containing protein [Candidatus Omnitrophica bacterium]|nr:glycogen-binding domain-containing protein [Candidatus Omnitrophota bacterium]